MGNKQSNDQAKNAFNPATIKRTFQPVEKALRPLGDKNVLKDGVGIGIGGLGSVLKQGATLGGKILNNDIVRGGALLLGPEAVAGLAGATVAVKGGELIGNGLEKAGNKINNKDNGVKFL